MSHAYIEDQLVEQPVFGLFGALGIFPTACWHCALFESLATIRINTLFILMFLFEWKTSR